jgi:lipopolysaccharide/colanic/teichoic acid biosynthesis glycosyltransferase
MLLINLDSEGPIFFKQKRSGFKGKVFDVYKFRTMVVNAEELKAKLMQQNEMTGPVFKMTNDPRITRVGKWLRKSGIDEFPQFLNVFLGDMSIVGPRPPLPAEVAQYERWQLRRLAMKPGITCLWQIAPSRNSISFEEWMRMDMEYIDNWSLLLDVIIIFKTVRTIVRADGK